jgi:pimeloyl-ACP methyl ester carboxylesterase
MRRLRRVRTVALDLPGAVRSASSPLPRRMSGYAHLVREILDGLHFERVHVMGISWGGALAQEFTHQHAERVSRVVLAATSSEPTIVPLRLRAGALYGGDFATDAALAESGARRLAPASPVGYLCMRFAQAGWSSTPWLRTLRRPTLVLAGDQDPIVPLAAAKALADGLPNAYFESFDCGHLFVLTRAQQVVAALERFLLESVPLIREPRHG